MLPCSTYRNLRNTSRETCLKQILCLHSFHVYCSWRSPSHRCCRNPIMIMIIESWLPDYHNVNSFHRSAVMPWLVFPSNSLCLRLRLSCPIFFHLLVSFVVTYDAILLLKFVLLFKCITSLLPKHGYGGVDFISGLEKVCVSKRNMIVSHLGSVFTSLGSGNKRTFFFEFLWLLIKWVPFQSVKVPRSNTQKQCICVQHLTQRTKELFCLLL